MIETSIAPSLARKMFLQPVEQSRECLWHRAVGLLENERSAAVLNANNVRA
jgi:hypothetical protein